MKMKYTEKNIRSMGTKAVAKKLYISIGIMLLILWVGRGSVYAEETIDKSEFESEQLYNALLELCDEGEHGNRNGVIDKEEAEAITTIAFTYVENNTGYYDFKGGISLKGIENFINLKVFVWHYIGENVPQLADYEYLPSLTDFQVWFQKNEDWSFLEKHSSLVNIHLEECNVKDISFLEKFPELQYLSFSNCNKIEDFSYVKSLNNLISLDLSGTKLTSLNFIEENSFKNLETLKVSNSLVRDISPVIVCSETLHTLWAIGLGLTEIPDMTKMNNLENLSLNNNYLTEDEILSKIPESVKALANWQQSVGVNNQLDEPIVDDWDDGNIDQGNDNDENVNQDNQGNINLDENNANLNNENNIQILTDGYVKIKGLFESGTYLEAIRLEKYSEYTKYEKQLVEYEIMSEDNKAIFYDISLYRDIVTDEKITKEKVQPKNITTVSIRLKQIDNPKSVGEVYVIRWEEDGTMTLLDSFYENDVVTFTSDHFSIFSIVMSKLVNESGDDEKNEYEQIIENIKIMGVGLVVIIIICLIIICEMKRRELWKKIGTAIGLSKY